MITIDDIILGIRKETGIYHPTEFHIMQIVNNLWKKGILIYNMKKLSNDIDDSPIQITDNFDQPKENQI
jgi:hypothetical protein